MTDDEKRQQKGALLLEYQETEETLSHLRVKAERMSAPFARVAQWLEDAQSVGISRVRTDRNAEIRSNLYLSQRYRV